MRPVVILAVPLLGFISGCTALSVLDRFDAGAPPAAATYPRLVDVPAAPPPGAFSTAAPDPDVGRGVRDDLSVRAALQNERADRLGAPELSEAERDRLGDRADRLADPVLTEAERARLRAAVEAR